MTKTIGSDFKTDIFNATINNNGKITKCNPVSKSDNFRKAEDVIKIQQCNRILAHNNEPLLTDAEADWMLDPLKNNINLETDDLQKLAGFEIDKSINYTK